jgi:hypothetical protein
MDRLGRSLGFAPRPPELIEQWVDRRGLRRMLQPWFDVIRLTTLMPIGNAGILRFVNSDKLNRLVGTVIPRRYLERLKEWAGLGYTVLALAQKRRL